jgi:hypothetical protein
VSLPTSVDALLMERERELDRVLDAFARATKLAREALRRLDGALSAAERELLIAIDHALARGEMDVIGEVLGLADVFTARFAMLVDEERARLLERLGALPRAGEDPAFLDLQHQEAQTHANALRPSVSRLVRDAEFQALVASGFDPIGGPWWALSHIRAQKRAAAVLARHGDALGVFDFASLVARHREEKSALETLDEDIATLNRARLAARHAAKERRDVEAALHDVDAHLRTNLRERILAALSARAESERRLLGTTLPFGLALVVVDGLRAKKRYVQATLAHHVERTASALANRRTDTAELRRAPSSYIQVERLAFETRSLVEHAERELALHAETVRRIEGFDDWVRAREEPNTVFFDLFVGEAVDAAYIDEVVWQRTTRSVTPSSNARVATWTENAAGAAERLAAIWSSVKDATPTEGSPSSVPLPISFDDEQADPE